MRRFLISIAVAAALLVVVRTLTSRAGPRMRARCHEMCARMLEEMPASSPLNRIKADLEALRGDADRILATVERLAGERV